MQVNKKPKTEGSVEKLKNRIEELERLNRLMVDRELKMVELKKEIKTLKKLAEKRQQTKKVASLK